MAQPLAQPDLHLLGQQLAGISEQVKLLPNIPAIAGFEAVLANMSMIQRQHNEVLAQQAQQHAAALAQQADLHAAAQAQQAQQHAAALAQRGDLHAAAQAQQAEQHAAALARQAEQHTAALAQQAEQHAAALAQQAEQHAAALAQQAEQHAAAQAQRAQQAQQHAGQHQQTTDLLNALQASSQQVITKYVSYFILTELTDFIVAANLNICGCTHQPSEASSEEGVADARNVAYYLGLSPDPSATWGQLIQQINDFLGCAMSG
jgi:hypothetical protein